MKEIRKAVRQGKKNTHFYFVSILSPTIVKLDKLGYKTTYAYGGVDVSWEEAETSITGREGEVSA